MKEGIQREDGNNRNFQSIISTHSSHIVAESDFNDIRYLKRTDESSVISKNLKSLELEYKNVGEDQSFRFLKQYLTLNKAELFFADKAILVEGDTERILLPAMMKKLDQETNENALLSQNISLVEVGAHSQVFEKFVDFIGIKTLIITDLDSAKVTKEDGKTKRNACKVNDSDASISTNASLKFFLGIDSLTKLNEMSFKQKCLEKETQSDKTKKWTEKDNGQIQIVFQTKEMNMEGGRISCPKF